jgi:hypothetical protein
MSTGDWRIYDNMGIRRTGKNPYFSATVYHESHMKSYWIELGPSELRKQRLSARVTARPTSEIIRYKYFRSRDSSVGIATDYRLDGRGLIPGRGNSLFHGVQTDSGAHPASYSMGNGYSFFGV